MFFAGLSGSAVADTSAIGSMLIPAMEKQGYTKKFAAAITAASSVIGPNYSSFRDNDYLRLCHG
jgi:TRAP-type C4-dicarboxylate transport system permease large subunit